MQHTSDTQKRSEKCPPQARSAPSSRGSPPGTDSDGAGLTGVYLDIFGRPPLGDHPQLDGYTAGRVLAEKYPGRMMKVMAGIRQGIKDEQKAADAGGESHA